MNIHTFLLFFTFTISLFAQQSDFYAIDFSEADGIAIHLEGEELKNLPLLAHNLTFNLETDAERFRAIYYWISHNIKGNQNLTDKNDRKRFKLKDNPEDLRAWNNSFKKEVFQKLITDKETLCTGYAFLIKTLANFTGIECEIIYGNNINNSLKNKNSTSPNHTWNAIKLNSKWYLCDVTWGAGYTNLDTNEFFFDYDNSHFLMEPKRFAKNHKPVNKKWTLLEQSFLRVN